MGCFSEKTRELVRCCSFGVRITTQAPKNDQGMLNGYFCKLQVDIIYVNIPPLFFSIPRIYTTPNQLLSYYTILCNAQYS
jgi:hypothetical protein